MKLILTTADGSWDITDMAKTVTMSGDKSAVARTLTASVLEVSSLGLPRPAVGSGITLMEGGKALFSGYVVQRTLDRDSPTMDISACDGALYLRSNQYTGKFSRAAPDQIVREVCREKAVPVKDLAAVPGALISRKFSGERIDRVIQTVYSLAGEQSGDRYAIRMTPEGLLVKRREISAVSVALVARSNLYAATTTESIRDLVNRVAIYDQQGVLVSRIQDDEAVRLYGVMETHLFQREGESAANEAKALLEDGGLARNVTVQAAGDARLLTGETVVVEEQETGLTGLFWIDADAHTWKDGLWTVRLTLNCRNVTTKVTGGSEL